MDARGDGGRSARSLDTGRRRLRPASREILHESDLDAILPDGIAAGRLHRYWSGTCQCTKVPPLGRLVMEQEPPS